MTLAEEKEALKRKLKEMGTKKKPQPKYKREPKDILNDPKGKFEKSSNFELQHPRVKMTEKAAYRGSEMATFT